MDGKDTRSLRLMLGWSQERLAREVGVSFCTVNRWERGKASPSPMAIRNLRRLKEEHGMMNKRTSVRLELHYPINIQRTAVPEGASIKELPSFTENLSIGGLMFRDTAADFKKGEILNIHLNLGEDNPVRTISEVIWLKDSGAGKTVGVKFSRINHRDMVKVMNTMLMNKP